MLNRNFLVGCGVFDGGVIGLRVRATAQTHVGGTPRSFRITEMELRGVLGGADLTAGGSATSSSGASANAFDNSMTTIWAALTDPAGEWVGYVFATPQTIAQIEIRAGTYFSQVVQIPEFAVDVTYDGSAWVQTHLFSPGNTWTADGSGYASNPLSFNL